jgi:hypothetical protein
MVGPLAPLTTKSTMNNTTPKASRNLILSLIAGLVVAATIGLYLCMQVSAIWREARATTQAQLRAVSGVYVFNRAIDGVTYTCRLQADGVCFLGLQIPSTSFSTGQGDIPAAVTRDNSGVKHQDGYKGRWEVRNHKVRLFTDGKPAAELTIQGRDLLTDDGALYARAE